MRTRFTRDELYENEGRNQGHTFKEGEVYDFTEDFSNRWTRRGAAEVIAGGEKAKLVGTSGPFKPIGGKAAQAPLQLQAATEDKVPAFAVGDKVVLKSGGPVLTVLATLLATPQDPEAVTVEWTNDDHAQQTDTFPVDAVEPCLDPAA